MATLEERMLACEQKLRELEAWGRLLRSDILADVRADNEAAKRHVESVVKAVTNDIAAIRTDLDAIKLSSTAAQKASEATNELLKEAYQEKGRRAQREEEIVLRGKLASVTGIEKKTDVEVEGYAVDNAVRKWKGYGAAFGVFCLAIGGLLAYVVGSHQQAPPPQRPEPAEHDAGH